MILWPLWTVLATLLPAAALRSRRAERENVPPPEYESWTAEDKVAWWKANLDVGSGGSKQVGNWWNDEAATKCMKEECIHMGGKSTRKDVVPKYSCRSRGAHAEGMVAFVRAVWEENPYTGMFQGADLGFARWGFQWMDQTFNKQSQAAEDYARGRYNPEPVPGSWEECDVKDFLNATASRRSEKVPGSFEKCDVKEDCWNVTKPPRYSEELLEDGERPNVAQFMALKFFRDGVPSAAVHTGLEGSLPTANFMSRTYSNLVVMGASETWNNTVIGSQSDQAAQRATRWPTFTGLHDMAMYDQEGRLQHEPNFPWQLIFLPTDASKGKIPENIIGFWPTQLKAFQVLKPGTSLFDIYAKHSFESPIVKIGRLELASEFMLSADTDRQVFFYHPRYERDLLLRPDLAEGYNCRDNRLCPLCPTLPHFCAPDDATLAEWLEVLATTIVYPETTDDFLGVYKRLGPLPKAARHAAGRSFTCAGRAALQGADRAPKGREEQSAQAAGMRADDWVVEPLTGLLREPRWFCAADGSWPNTPRGLAEGCNSTLVPWHLRNEPEYAVEPGCQSLPACTKTDGTWYSTSYPCLCGISTCSTGQLCMGRTSTCTTWGPYAKVAAAAEV